MCDEFKKDYGWVPKHLADNLGEQVGSTHPEYNPTSGPAPAYARVNPTVVSPGVFGPVKQQELDFPPGTFVVSREDQQDEQVTLLTLSRGADETLKKAGFIRLEEFEQFGVVVMPAGLAGYVFPVSIDTHYKVEGPQGFERIMNVVRSVVSGLEESGFKVTDPYTLSLEADPRD